MTAMMYVVLPLGSVAGATALTSVLWPYVQPSATPLFFLAVMASALYGGAVAGSVATAASTASIAFWFMAPALSFSIGSDDVFRLIAFGSAAVVTNSIAAARNRAEEQQRRLIAELRAANKRIKTLSDLLPICPHCKRVRTADTSWKPLQQHLEEASDLRMTHALCPDCASHAYPEFQPVRS
jgi:K+-sensing histidine kinase KdpD